MSSSIIGLTCLLLASLALYLGEPQISVTYAAASMVIFALREKVDD